MGIDAPTIPVTSGGRQCKTVSFPKGTRRRTRPNIQLLLPNQALTMSNNTCCEKLAGHSAMAQARQEVPAVENQGPSLKNVRPLPRHHGRKAQYDKV
jgi:hypothetical protein